MLVPLDMAVGVLDGLGVDVTVFEVDVDVPDIVGGGVNTVGVCSVIVGVFVCVSVYSTVLVTKEVLVEVGDNCCSIASVRLKESMADFAVTFGRTTNAGMEKSIRMAI